MIRSQQATRNAQADSPKDLVRLTVRNLKTGEIYGENKSKNENKEERVTFVRRNRRQGL